MRHLRVDLHTHTCLSPCGDARMIPPRILRRAAEKHIDVIGISDHNSAENVAAVQEIASDYGVTVIGGMEVTTQEEAHILAFFDGIDQLQDFQAFIYRHLHGSNSPDDFGHQWVVDSDGGVIDMNPRLLFGAAELSVQRVTDAIHELSGVAIAAHVDRPTFSVLSQLGFIPDDLDLDAVELSPFYRQAGFDPETVTLPWVTFSDAHYIEEIGRTWIDATVSEPSVAEIRMALAGVGGRSIAAGRT